MNEFQQLSEKLSFELATLEQYEKGDLALTSNQLSDLHCRVNNLKKQRLAACKHPCVIGKRESSTHEDEYGSYHTTYYVRLYCKDCNQCLLEKWDARDYVSSWLKETGTMALRKGCVWFDQQPGAYSSRNSKMIEDYGVRKVERRVVEYV